MSDGPTTDPRIYLAVERTFLAWIRTGLALMGFGFVVARFGLFLRQIALTPKAHPFESTGGSLLTGTTLLVLGAVINIAATIHHVGLIGKLNRGETIGRPSSVAMALALGLALLGLALASYLVLLG